MDKKIMYRHVRIVDETKMMLNILTGSKYTSIYDIPQRKAGTICLTYDEKEVRVGLALCSPDDNFSRRIGRELSYERNLNMPWTVFNVAELESQDDDFIFNYCIKELNRIEKYVASNFRELQLEGFYY
ncbi:MAG: hypothetical protein WC996_04355 [Peptostreptococcales bacterium]|jgi:hypothetical protein